MASKATQRDINVFAPLAVTFGFVLGLIVAEAISIHAFWPLVGRIPLTVLALGLLGGYHEIYDALPPENKHSSREKL